MKLWIVTANENGCEIEPQIFSSVEDALADATETILDHAERWDYDEDECKEAIADLTRCAAAGRRCFGTYLGELDINFYEKEIDL